MDSFDHLVHFLYRTRNKTNRFRRLIFPSPAELRLIELMGGKVVRFTRVRDPRTKFPVAVIVTKGKFLRAQNVRREVRYGPYYVDFANDLHRIIEVDGAAWHADVVADMDREVHIRNRNREARFLRISAMELRRQPAKVREKVRKFLD